MTSDPLGGPDDDAEISPWSVELRATVCGLFAALSVIISVSVNVGNWFARPVVASTPTDSIEIVQLVPAGKTLPQVDPITGKFCEDVWKLPIVMAVVPGFESVTSCKTPPRVQDKLGGTTKFPGVPVATPATLKSILPAASWI